jgi:hypothetical protein
VDILGVGFSVVVTIIFVARSILNRHRFDGSISTRPFPAEIVETLEAATSETHPSISISRLRHLCVVIAWFICRLLFRVYRAQSAGDMQVSGIHWMPLAVTSFLPLLSLAYVFASHCSSPDAGDAARWCCLHFVYLCSYGTILGGLTIYARHAGVVQFTLI